MALVLDLSNYDHPADGACLAGAGVTGVILGAQIPSLSRQIATTCRANGIALLGTYAFLWDVETPEIRVRKAIDLALEFGMGTVWLDAEEGNNMPAGFNERAAALVAGEQAITAAGLRAGVYTYEGFWREKMLNTAAFARLPLWHANFGANDGTMRSPIETVTYGGWAKVAIHQATSTLVVCGRGRDANYVFEEDDMTPEQARELRLLREDLTATTELLTDARNDIFQLQVQVFGEEAAAAGRTSAYATTAGILATNGQIAVELDALRETVADLTVNGALPNHIHAAVPSGQVVEAKG